MATDVPVSTVSLVDRVAKRFKLAQKRFFARLSKKDGKGLECKYFRSAGVKHGGNVSFTFLSRKPESGNIR